jgi:hypothetical protein
LRHWLHPLATTGIIVVFVIFILLQREDLEWATETSVLCIAGQSDLDEAAASMLAQLLVKHSLGARVEGAKALLASNIFRLETTGDAMVCLSYLDGSSRAHMRYMIRRLRRKLPNIRVLLGCWLVDGDAVTLGEAVKADDVATTLRDAVRLCLEAARAPDHERKSKVGEAPTMRGSGARDLTEAAV